MQKFEITDAEGGTAFLVQVTPEADANQIMGKDDDLIFVNLTSAADVAEVNRDLIAFFAQKLGMRAEQITLASGVQLQKKIVIVTGLHPAEVERRLFL